MIPPDLILEAYRKGYFPMAAPDNPEQTEWVMPHERGILPIKELNIPRSLKKIIKRNLSGPGLYHVTINTVFRDIIEACALETPDRPHTWINRDIIEGFCALHETGHAHSVEIWQGGALAGGLYGLQIGAAFFGESMFSRRPNASKISLVHLAARLSAGGFELLDAQFMNAHLAQFGIMPVPGDDYLGFLGRSLSKDADFLLSGIPEHQIMTSFMH